MMPNQPRDPNRPWLVCGIIVLILGSILCCVLFIGLAWTLGWLHIPGLPTPNPTGATAAPVEQVTSAPPQPTEEVLPTETEQPTQTPQPTATSQPSGVRAEYRGVRFSFDPFVAQDWKAEVVPASSNPDVPWENNPEYIQFSFIGYALSETFHEAHIAVYPVKEYGTLSPAVKQEINRLRQLLADRPTTINESIPFLPMWNAAQVMKAQVKYLNFEQGSGVRFLTQYGQDVSPINNNALFYTFQGLTSDGKYYISAILPVNHPSLPASPEEGIPGGNYDQFTQNYAAYLQQIQSTLNTLPAGSFQPDLALLDTLIQSLSIQP